MAHLVMNYLYANSVSSMFQTIEIPSLKVSKKVKSMQMFKKPVDKAIQVARFAKYFVTYRGCFLGVYMHL